MTVEFVVIDSSGEMRLVDRPSCTVVDGDVLAPGPVDRFPFQRHGLVGFVAAEALLRGLPRNPGGGFLLVTLVAPIGVYAGPIAVCGFDPDVEVVAATADRLRPLGAGQVRMLTGLVEDITAAVGGGATGRGDPWDERARRVCRVITRLGVADTGRRAPAFFSPDLGPHVGG